VEFIFDITIKLSFAISIIEKLLLVIWRTVAIITEPVFGDRLVSGTTSKCLNVIRQTKRKDWLKVARRFIQQWPSSSDAHEDAPASNEKQATTGQKEFCQWKRKRKRKRVSPA